MFSSRPGVDKKAALLAQAKADRLARSGQKKIEEQNALQEKAASRIQASWRRIQHRRAMKDQQRLDWDTLSTRFPSTPALGLIRNLQLAYLLLKFYDPAKCPMDSRRLSTLCKLILSKTVIIAEERDQAVSKTDTPPQSLSLNDSALISQSSETEMSGGGSDIKPMVQVPFQMILLHSRYSELGISVILRLLQQCIKSMIGYRVEYDALSSSNLNTSGGKASTKANAHKPTSLGISNDALYLSGSELRFVMAYIDINTYRLPEAVNPLIRTQMTDRGKALITKIFNSGEFYKEIKPGVSLRVEALLQLKERSKKTALVPIDSSRQKALSLWITAVWRCCLLLPSVDKEVIEKPAKKSNGKQYKDDLINLYSDDSTSVSIACYILTVPLLMECLDGLCIQLAWQNNTLEETLDVILDLRHQQYILSIMSLNDTLSLIGNMIQLYRSSLSKNTDAVNTRLNNQLVEAVTVLLTHCRKNVSTTQTAEFRQYHPIFSWTRASQRKQQQQLSNIQVSVLLQQLEYLWSREYALSVFRALLDASLPAIQKTDQITSSQESTPSTSRQNRFSSPLELALTKSGEVKWSEPQNTLLAIEVQQSCLFYMTLMKLFDAQKPKILVTLMYLPSFLTHLWRLMLTLGPKGGMVIYLEAAATGGARGKGLDQEPLIAILQIFCECCARFFITLDDDDMYEQQKTWGLSELVFMSGFFNQFCFSILSQQENLKNEDKIKNDSNVTSTESNSLLSPPLPPIFYHARQVLMQLYERDCRRAFCPPNHWLLIHPSKSVFQSPLQLLASLTLSSSKNSSGSKPGSSPFKSGGGIFSFPSSKSPPQYSTPKEYITKIAQKDRTALQILETMSHVIPFNARLEIFRNFIKEEKAQRAQALALVRPDLHQSFIVKVRRGYILEDGYKSLAQLSNNGWKNTIRVKFVNEVGADEAGIDQGGPFKEFMESFLEAGFSPNLNLFTTSTASMNMLYPSPTSHYTHPSNGLELFRLFGKMLGKAMYEGLLVDVKFANFFLSKILGRTVFLDEMRSYDEQVYQNLMFVKKYDGNIEDLGLTFSLDEEVFGTHRTIELIRGGKDVEVTKDNRINYIFKLSDYRLNKQIQEQSKAFIEGYRSIIPLHWISIFSPQELQRVMAGEDVDFDVQDLRAHTEYQNGYFDQHPVIRNLWAVLDEFNSEEKRAFLKFVTSCSKPPLGGFKHLYPPFSIRLVMNPTVSDQSHDGPQANASRRVGSSTNNSSSQDHHDNIQPHQRNATATSIGSSGGSASGGRFGSRLRSALSVNNSSRSNERPQTATSFLSSSRTSRSSLSSSSSSPSPFTLTTDEHGTPAALGVVKSFFGGVLGSTSSSSESAGKKARLPTSSTCFNLLKLPPFTSKSVLREKLRYAIMSNTGFELS